MQPEVTEIVHKQYDRLTLTTSMFYLPGIRNGEAPEVGEIVSCIALYVTLVTSLFFLPGIRNGEAPEVAEIVRERYDTDLEMAKTLMQQEFEETLESEQVSSTSYVYCIL